MLKNSKIRKKGFTLTEVLVVVLIIGVMTAVAYPVYTKTIIKSRAVEAINLLEMVRNKQIANFARKGEYIKDFKGIGQLTNHKDAEIAAAGDIVLKVGKYELAMNNATNCMSAAYIPMQNKPAAFTFSSSYEQSGLGCDGDVCKSFGNIVGAASTVCNCGAKSCTGNRYLDTKTCQCECNLPCTSGGVCENESLKKETTMACGNGGTTIRTCTPSCGGGTCSHWGDCSGQTCSGSQPSSSEACGNCGTKTRAVKCNDKTGGWDIGSWGACVGTRSDTKACGAGYTGNQTRVCNNDIWGSWNTAGCVLDRKECTSSKPAQVIPCTNCGQKTRSVTCDYTTGQWVAGDYSTCKGEGAQTQDCSTGIGTQTRICKNNIWDTWNTSACKVDKCAGRPPKQDTRACGNCGIETGTIRCDPDTGAWLSTSWSGNCTGQGPCPPGTSAQCTVSGLLVGTSKCSASCTWGPCTGPILPPEGGQCKISGCGINEYMVRPGTSTCCCESKSCGKPVGGPNNIGYCKCLDSNISDGGGGGIIW